MKAEFNIISNAFELTIKMNDYTDRMGAILRADGYELMSNGWQDADGDWCYIYMKPLPKNI